MRKISKIMLALVLALAVASIVPQMTGSCGTVGTNPCP